MTDQLMLDNLTATQQRCTELLNELRGWRHGCGDAVSAVVRECWSAKCKYGEQRCLPFGTDEANGEIAEALKSRAAESWFEVLYEEVWEVAAETDPKRLRAELLQVACVALNWIGVIDAND